LHGGGYLHLPGRLGGHLDRGSFLKGVEIRSSAYSPDMRCGIISFDLCLQRRFAEGAAQKYLAHLLFVRKAGG
jgi:hypothetical protein